MLLDDDCLGELVNFSLKDALLDGLNDVSLDLVFFNFQDLWYLLVADYLHIGTIAAQYSWDGFYLDSSLKFIHIDTGCFNNFFIQFFEGLEISQNQTL